MQTKKMLIEQLSPEIVEKVVDIVVEELYIKSISINGKIVEPDVLKNVDISIPTTLPASDVYEWAKRPEKPIYTAEEVGADPLGSSENAKMYTDEKIQELVGTSPENLDTIYELAQAILDNESIVNVINEAISQKVDKVIGKGLSTNDLTDELVQKWNAKSDFSGDYNDLSNKPVLGGGTEIEIDDAMSDNSENVVQNKVIKSYVDTYIGQFRQYQKYVNIELDYAYLQTDLINDLTLSVGTVIPFDKVIEAKGIEIDFENYGVVLKAGKTYELLCDVYCFGITECGFYDLTNNMFLSIFNKVSANINSVRPDTVGILIISPVEDITIQIKVNFVNTSKVDKENNIFSNFVVKEISRAITIDPVEYVNKELGIEDTPVGHIISHMGIKAPKHYLVCDGTEYDIKDYPYLSEHIKEELGSYNFFGGDGETTFAVPDLRGEFLRGSGGEASLKRGSGGNVGQHQDPTIEARQVTNVGSGGRVFAISADIDNMLRKNEDFASMPNETENYLNFNGTRISGSLLWQTSRPTNTSVLYCIKYEPTYFMNLSNNYSYEEHIVGTWVDGKPLYEKTVNFGSLPNMSSKEVLHRVENADIIWVQDGFVYGEGGVFAPLVFSSQNSVFDWYVESSKDSIKFTTGINGTNKQAMVTIRYTKTIDEVNVKEESEKLLENNVSAEQSYYNNWIRERFNRAE